MLKGELRTFSLGEVFQSLAINNHTGTLKITAPGKLQKLIYFEKGTITLFSSGGAGPARIGDVLVREGKLTPEKLEEALAEQKETKELLGEILLRRGLVTEKDLRRALEKKIREELYDLFLWKEGSFEFHLDCFPEHEIDDLQRKTRIALDVKSVTMEGLRRLDEWTLIQKELRTLNEILAKTGADYAGSDPLEKHILERVDGTKPAREVIEGAPGGTFECSKALYGLIASGCVRKLSLEELVARAEESAAARRFPKAAAYLKFAAELDPENPELRRKLGDAFSAYYQEELAAKAYLAALRLHYQRGEFREAADIGQNLLRRNFASEEDLERLFLALLELGELKRAVLVANQLANVLQKASRFAKAAGVFEKLAEKCPNDIDLKLRAAQMVDRAGEKERAAALLEGVARDLEANRRYRDLVRVLRFLSELNPKRQDLRERVAEAKFLLEKHQRRVRRRFTLAGTATILTAVAILIPILYEIKSAEAIQHCKRLEEIDALGETYARSKAAYHEFLSRFSLSRRRSEARAALERIEAAEKTRQRALEERARLQKQEQEARLQDMLRAISSARIQAATAEAERDFRKAHGVYAQILRDYSEHPSTKSILLPVLITSDPSGATVTVDGAEVGKTPLVYRYRPGTAATIGLSRQSCEPLARAIELRDQWELHFELRRKPLAGFIAASNVQQPMVAASGLIFLLSREAGLYAVNVLEKTTVWQRTVGRFGDRLSNLAARGDDVYLGTVSAEVAAISASTGRSRWISRVGGSVLAAPGVSEDGRWVAVGTTRGTVEVLDSEKGALVARFATENEILARPVFVGPLLLAGSTDNSLYGYSMEEKGLVFVEDLGADIAIDPCIFGSAVAVATAAREVHLFDTVSRKTVWTWRSEDPDEDFAAMTASDSCVLLGTSRGSILALDGKTGALAWRLPVGYGAVAGFCRSGKKLYATVENGAVCAVDVSSGKKLWEHASEETFVVPPIVLGRHLCVLGLTGKLQYIEVSE